VLQQKGTEIIAGTALMAIGVAMLAGMSSTSAAEARREAFGTLADGTPVDSVVLTNAAGVRARILTLGATLQSLETPDRRGALADIVLGYEKAARYLSEPQYFGVTVGRYANRIAKGVFTLDGHGYELATNDGENHLHGGIRGFDKVVWRIEEITEGPAASVVLSYLSPDGEEGYPGNLKVKATYSLNERNELSILYEATTDAPTIVNITNHSIFNLAGESSNESVLGHSLRIEADRFTPVDAQLIPTGERTPVTGTPFDFRELTPIGRRIREGGNEQILFGRGYDHNFVIRGEPGTLRPAARLVDPGSGRVLELLSTAPGLQVYSGNFLDGSTIGKSGRVYRQSDGIALEPQTFPNAPNEPGFPSARLNPGETYANHMVFRLSVID